MSTFGLTVYVLVWPVMATGVLAVLCIGLMRDIRQARKKGKRLI